MDHKVSKDMISSGMIPSGEKTQADLGRTQYGSAPSPSSLMDAYRTIYEHHQKDADGKVIEHEGEELNEGKIPAGLQAYLDKKKGKKEDKKEVKEEVDKFNIVYNHFISEGYSEKEAYSKMANLTEEQLDEFVGAAMAGLKAVGGALLKKGVAGLAKAGAGKAGLKATASAFKEMGFSIENSLKDFKKFPQTLINLKVDSPNRIIMDDKFWEKVTEIETHLGDSGRVLIRPSGTEPLIRVMVEGEDGDTVDKMARELSEIVTSLGTAH